MPDKLKPGSVGFEGNYHQDEEPEEWNDFYHIERLVVRIYAKSEQDVCRLRDQITQVVYDGKLTGAPILLLPCCPLSCSRTFLLLLIFFCPFQLERWGCERQKLPLVHAWSLVLIFAYMVTPVDQGRSYMVTYADLYWPWFALALQMGSRAGALTTSTSGSLKRLRCAFDRQ